MTEFKIRLADINIGVRSLFDSTRSFCREYLTEADTAFEVELSREDIDFEREKSRREDELEGIPVRNFSDEYLETLALYRKIVVKLLDFNIVLFHGAVIEMEGRGILFTAVSGTGKSTHIALWKRLYGDRVTIVNGDKPLIRITEKGATVYGTPWQGKENLGCNMKAPLGAIVVLERSPDNRIEEIRAGDALVDVIRQTYRPKEPAQMLMTLDTLNLLTGRISFYRLGCNMDIDAARVAHDGILG